MSVSLQFPLIRKDDWPPVGTESLPFDPLPLGFRALVAPLFVKDLSVGDVIRIVEGDSHLVGSWTHIQKSRRTTIWLLRLDEHNEIDASLEELRSMGCNTVGLPKFGCYAVDVPEEISIVDVDAVLAKLDSNSVAVVFPSMRHPD